MAVIGGLVRPPVFTFPKILSKMNSKILFQRDSILPSVTAPKATSVKKSNAPSAMTYSAAEYDAVCNDLMWAESEHSYSAEQYDAVCNDLMWAHYDVEEANASLSVQAETLDAQATMLTQQAQALKAQADEIAALKKALKRRDKEITRLRADRDEMYVVVEKALADAVEAEDCLEKAKHKREALKAKAAMLEEELTQAEECYYAAMSDVEDERAEKRALEKRVESLEATAAATRSLRFKAMDERDGAKKELGALNNLLNTAAMAAEAAEKRLKGKGKAESLIRRLETAVGRLESTGKAKRA
jgi:chromosome segregation ATPase